MTNEQLYTLLKTYADHVGRAPATIARRAGAYAHLPKRLEEGAGCSVRTMNDLAVWFSDNWPDDLEWPRNIPRPKAQPQQMKRSA